MSQVNIAHFVQGYDKWEGWNSEGNYREEKREYESKRESKKEKRGREREGGEGEGRERERGVREAEGEFGVFSGGYYQLITFL